MKHIIQIIFYGSFLLGCQIQPADNTQKTPIARVHDNYLYKSDLEGIVSNMGLKTDSADIAEGYVNTWVKRQLLFQKAEDEVEAGLEDIEDRVEEYKYQLILYTFQKQYIHDNLDTIVRQNEIQSYYDQHTESFNLKEDIIRGKFVKILFKDPKKEEVINWIKSKEEEDTQKLKSHCIIQADQYLLDDRKWVDTHEIIRSTPFSDFINRTNAKSKKLITKQDASYIYILRIDEYLSKGELAPVEYVKKMITDIIISKRKVELKQSLEQQIFSQASQNKDYEIYR